MAIAGMHIRFVPSRLDQLGLRLIALGRSPELLPIPSHSLELESYWYSLVRISHCRHAIGISEIELV